MSYNHQHLAYNRLSRYTGFQGLRILEIGGHQNAESAMPFVQAGATEVIVTGLNHVQRERVDEQGRIRVMRADAHKLVALFGRRSFDVVYGLSIIEHIPMLSHFLEQVAQVLRPGGFAFFEGDPLWSSPRGHHVWVRTSHGDYFFATPAGTRAFNPVPDWAHLLMERAELEDTLHRLHPAIPAQDVQAICDYIHAGPDLTRVPHGDIAASFSRAPLVTLSMVANALPVPPEIGEELRRRHGTGHDYGVSAVQYVLRKPDGAPRPPPGCVRPDLAQGAA